MRVAAGAFGLLKDNAIVRCWQAAVVVGVIEAARFLKK
jgi:hypothetical protein